VSQQLSLAFGAGMVAAINPCGFALLPAYLSYFLGLESKEGAQLERQGNPFLRALGVSAAMTAGFVVVFAPMGALWSSVSGVLGDRLPWVTAALGVGLVVLGIAMFRGFQPVVRLPKLQMGTTSEQLGSVFLFGVSYAVASLSCTIGVFGALVTSSFERDSFLVGVLSFVVYALGMGLVIAILTMAVSFAQQGIVTAMRRLLPHMGRISGTLVIIAGLYVAYYGWWEAQVLAGNDVSDGVAGRVNGWRDAVANWISEVGEVRLGVLIALLLAAGVGIGALRRRRSHT